MPTVQEILAETTNIELLNQHGSSTSALSQEEIATLAYGYNNGKYKKIDLSTYSLRGFSAEAITTIFGALGSHVTTLDLSCTDLIDLNEERIEALSAQLHDYSLLETLILEDCGLQEMPLESFKKIVDAIYRLPQLSSLQLLGNDFSCEQMEFIRSLKEDITASGFFKDIITNLSPAKPRP